MSVARGPAAPHHTTPPHRGLTPHCSQTFDLAERVRTLDAGIQQSPEFIKSKAARGGGALADADGTMDTMESETM